MGEDVIKLPLIKIEVPKPKPWDLIALLCVVATVAVAAVNLVTAVGRQAPGAVSGTTTAIVVTAQLLLCTASLLVLGKTAKHGTLWGNLAAVTGLFVAMSGVLLAAALWAAA